MALLLVKDVTNSKLKELECDASGNLKVDKVDVSALATESTMSAMDAKISACDTGNISGVVAVSAVSGDVACTHASLPLPTGAATESSLSTIAGCEVSSDNLDWFDLQDKFVNVDYASGHFGIIMDTPFKYIRLKRLADAGDSGSDSLSCIISGK